MDNGSGLRLPLDLLLCCDVDTLEEALQAQYAFEFECEIYFCKTQADLEASLQEYDDPHWYQLDDIENDRIMAVIDLLNKAEEDIMLGHILDRIVK
jgi:hypothetical protein